ncbi:type II toxin-antitoxin system RelE/ParE family toxin [Saccharicrinis sp. FJH54]|uniref:type II toxin-antitoxin system RelE/ParE family toxin n=1 Tax=Saccharicrinis sp. FJH54 TaxID=3344665 RepID=UPI0035D4C848
MIIIFADRNLRKYANDNKLAIKKMGQKRAKLFQRRLEDMSDSESFADLEYLPGRFHQLTHNRQDHWSCDLDHPYRLIFKPAEDPIPKDNAGKQILIEIKSLEIIEVINYHKEG